MQKADDLLQPRAQLSTLPDELKAYIARLCAEQDDAAREALVDAEQRFARFPGLRGEILALKSKLEGSVGALYATSKDWQAIAAPYGFQVRLIFIRATTLCSSTLTRRAPF